MKSLQEFFFRATALRRPAMRALIFGAVLAIAASQGSVADDLDYADLSLEDLMAAEVTSVARKRQRVSDTAAAVFVIRQDDIRRSGARTIPELLRMVPGLEVARIDADATAVSARGFNSRLSTKLLVLIDGRWVYTPSAGSVLWGQIGVPLEQIERIEVVRGPGAATWGANAVNAVINIITKHAADTLGPAAAARLESNSAARAFAQYGSALSESTAARIFAEATSIEPLSDASGGELTGDARAARAGFRIDYEPNERDAVTVQGDVSRGDFELALAGSIPVPPFRVVRKDQDDFFAGNLLLRWSRTLSEDADFSIQTYIDHLDRQDFVSRSMADVEAIAQTSLASWSSLSLGAGYRFTHDSFASSDVLQVTPNDQDSHWFGAFAQHDAELVQDTLTLSLGGRLEHNRFSGFEAQPSARLLYTPTANHTFWGAASMATRTPSVLETDASYPFGAIPAGAPGNPGPLPLVLTLRGAGDAVDSERLTAFEAGYRGAITDRFNVDIAGYYNEYSDLIATGVSPAGAMVTVDPATGATIVANTAVSGNFAAAKAYGVEIAADVTLTDWWRLKAAATHQRLDYDFDEAALMDASVDYSGLSPTTSVSLRSQMDLTDDIEFDVWLRHVGELDGVGVEAHTDLDLRLGWRVTDSVEISLVGRNLLSERREEFSDPFYPAPRGNVERSAYFSANVRF